MLFYGFIRPYKGLDLLIEAMGRLKNEDIHLTVAGEFWEGKRETEDSIQSLGIQEKVELVPHYISEQDTAAYFVRADVVVLPYRSATGSGVVPIAYHYGKPVIATKVGGLPEVVVNGKTGVLLEKDDIDGLVGAIKSFTKERAEKMGPAIEQVKPKMRWEGLAEEILRNIVY